MIKNLRSLKIRFNEFQNKNELIKNQARPDLRRFNSGASFYSAATTASG